MDNNQELLPLIEVKNLKKYFNTAQGKLHAVDDITFNIDEGQTIGVVGESGCGKSTLGRTILRLLEPTDGHILYRGQDITKIKRSEMIELRSKLQMIFQDPYSSIDPRMTVSGSISEPIRVRKSIKKKSDIDLKVKELMDTVGLAERFANAYPHELDGGRRQRIGVARALALNPEFIVCDEPVSALDVSIQAQILNLLMDLQEERNLTYMFITHDLSVVKHISNKIMVMYLGQCVEFCDTEELFMNPLHPYTKALLDAIPTTNLNKRWIKHEIIKGEVSNPINPKPGCRFMVRCPFAEAECASGFIGLKEVSLDHQVACIKYR